jgi:hypothetical protein
MTDLKLKIEGYNKINALTMAEIINIVPQLQKYIGTKINTLNGKSKKFIINFTGNFNHHCYFDISNHSIWLKTSISLPVPPHSCEYFKKEIYLGEMKSDILISVNPIVNIIQDWKLDIVETMDNVLSQIKEYKETKAKLDKIEGAFNLGKDVLKYY